MGQTAGVGLFGERLETGERLEIGERLETGERLVQVVLPDRRKNFLPEASGVDGSDGLIYEQIANTSIRLGIGEPNTVKIAKR